MESYITWLVKIPPLLIFVIIYCAQVFSTVNFSQMQFTHKYTCGLKAADIAQLIYKHGKVF